MSTVLRVPSKLYPSFAEICKKVGFEGAKG